MTKQLKTQTSISVQEPQYYYFVYGTLMKGFERRRSLEKRILIESHGDFKLYGYQILVNENINSNIDYPIIRYTGNKKDYVIGELIQTNFDGAKMICGVEIGYIPTPIQVVLNPDDDFWGPTNVPQLISACIFLAGEKAIAQFNESTSQLKHSFRTFVHRTKNPKFQKLKALPKK